nr:MAG TPA: hypothetical protein [Caudoviricetes sp.]
MASASHRRVRSTWWVGAGAWPRATYEVKECGGMPVYSLILVTDQRTPPPGSMISVSGAVIRCAPSPRRRRALQSVRRRR